MRYRSIRTKLLSSFGITFSVLYALLVGTMLFLASRYFSQNTKKNALSFVKLTFKDVSEIYVENFSTNPLRFAEKINHIFNSIPDLSRIVIFDSVGTIVFSTTQLFSKGDEILPLSPSMINSFELTEKLDKEYYVLVPILNETGRNIHSILYCFSREKEFQFRRFIAIFGFFIYSVLFLGTLVIDNLLMAQFVRNIEKLKRIAELVQSGDYSVRSSIKSGDEIMFLSDTINSMLESMTSYIYNLRAMVEELEARDKARDEILAKISHELRTPLTASKGYVELLLSENMGNLSEEQRKALEIILRNLNRLEDETRKLLQSSKVAIENVQIDLRGIDVEKAFEEIKENFESEIQKKDLKLIYKFEVNKVCADLEQFRSILENLLSNAVKFTPQGGLIEVRTSVEEVGDKSYFKISLFNTSPKIPESELDKIFEPFFQVNNGTKREKGGFGLGLYIVKRAVELHKGFVRALNTENGVKFEVYLPFLEVCNEEDPNN